MKKFIATMSMALMVLSMLAACGSTQAKNTNAQAEAPITEASAVTSEPNETVEETSNVVTESSDTQAEEPIELTVLAAASLTDATTELAELYKKVAPNVTLTFSYGASGALQTQIEEGAPADLFLSAASKQMNALDEEGLLLADTRVDLLQNKIVLIVPANSSLGLTSFEEVGEDTVRTIALGEPDAVPVGQYAEQVFTNLGMLDAVTAKTNYGSDVKQVLTWVESGEADCGVVYSTDAKISHAVTIVCEAPEGTHEDIIYPAAVIGSSASPEAAKAFLDYLSTEEAASVFEEYGFSMK